MRFVFSVSYLGARFCGWQTQKKQTHTISIQHSIELALSKIADDEKISVIASGRTDAGVNAISQVAHFDTNQIRDEKIWLSGANHFLPSSIKITDLRQIDCNFHSRYDAKKRTYRYLIYQQNNQSKHSPFLENRALWVKEKLDLKRMRKASKTIIGEHNFNAFRKSDCQAKTSIRKVFDCKIKSIASNIFCVEITANAFLHNMMRILVSALLEVAKNNQSIGYLKDLIDSQKRDFSLKTIAPHGLYLYQVQYPKKYPIKRLDKKIRLSHFLAI